MNILLKFKIEFIINPNQDLEKDMIQRLQIQGYEYLNIHRIDDASVNLRVCMEELNNVKFTDAEWQRICLDNLLKKGTGIKDKTKLIQCTQDDGSSFFFAHGDGRVTNIKLIDKYNIYRNKLQVINVVNIDYILALVAKYQKEWHKNKEIPVDIFRAINSNLELRPKKELIEYLLINLMIQKMLMKLGLNFGMNRKPKN